ncbi:Nonribosomal peptide synthetase 1 [Talaromyces pinophilus]|nr:Nonribosomal peptide synthetase 1 [Talaromyces pinophilus]
MHHTFARMCVSSAFRVATLNLLLHHLDLLNGLMNKSKWAAVAMLAILHSGGGVLPLGVQHPISRIQDILVDTAATILLADREQAERLQSIAKSTIIIDELLFQDLDAPADQAAHQRVSFSNIGPSVPVSRVTDQHSASTKTFQFAACIFDVSIQELLSTLIYGGCICIPSEDQRIGALAETINKFKVNLLGLTSSTASLLRPSDVPTVQRLVLFGEAVKPSVVEAWSSVGVHSAYDTQIKIHGQRLDVGEVEYWITKLNPSVGTAVVDLISPNDNKTQKILVAAIDFVDDTEESNTDFVTLPPSEGFHNTFTTLREALRQKLPSYMVPTAFELMPYASLKSAPQEVKNEAERILRSLWADVLHMDEVTTGSEDDFFALGADSILAMRLIGVGNVKGIKLDIKNVFRNSTLEKMALSMEQISSNGVSISLVYESFSLFQKSEVKGLVASLNTMGTQVFERNILDVLPTTDSQAFSVVGALTRSQVEVHYFKIDGDCQYDVDHLLKVCYNLCNSIEAFRTVYMFYGDELLQVVWDTYLNEIPVLEVDGSLDSATSQLYETQQGPMKLGRSMIHITILSPKGTMEHRILFRMSHTIYDGASFPIIWQTFQRLYAGESALQKTEFSRYLYSINSNIMEASHEYWRNLLRGSTMPQLSQTRIAQDQTPRAMQFCPIKKVPVGKSSISGMTNAIIVKAAWALILGHVVGTPDIVFGDTVSGRNIPDGTNFDNVVGSCATHVPFRINLESLQTGADLLLAVQDQHFDRMPYENLGFRSIINDCSEWPPSTRFTSIVNHRLANPTSIELGGNNYSVDNWLPEAGKMTNLYDIAVVSEEIDGHLELTFGCAEDSISPVEATNLLDLLCTAFLLSIWSPTSQSALYRTQSSSSAQDDNLILQGSKILDIWHSLFGHKHSIASSSLSSSPFFDLGGDLVDAARFVSTVQRHGIKITLDDILTYPSLDKLVYYLA